MPHFFQFAKDKLPYQTEPINQSPMNRLCCSISDSKIKYCKTIGKFDYRMLMNQAVAFDINVNSAIIEQYKYYNKRQNLLFKTDDESHSNQEELFMYQYICNKIIEETGEEIDYIVNTLVSYLYTVQKTGTKKMLWACFGDVIVANLRRNTADLGKICVVCGKRFMSITNNQITCGGACGHMLDMQKRRVRHEKTPIQENP